MPLPSNIPYLGKVLVIDDNPIIQRAVYFALRDHGIPVLMCGDVTDSLHIVREELPDLVVLDINFPPDGSLIGGERDGFWALDWLRRVDEIRNTPVIMISSAEAETTAAKALAAGASAFLPKPLDRRQLVDLVKKLLTARSAKSATVAIP